MKKFKQILTLAILILAISSCSSVKVTDAWKADGIGSMRSEKFLVIARSDDMVTRQRFEQEIATKLREGGLDATESYTKFPAMKHNQKRTPEEITELVQIIKNEGFQGIVLTVLKDKSSEIVTSQTGGYTTGGYGGYHGGYYGGGFGGYEVITVVIMVVVLVVTMALCIHLMDMVMEVLMFLPKLERILLKHI